MIDKADQRQRIFKAKIALALQDEFGRKPKAEEIEQTYHLARVLYKAVLGTHYLKKKQQQAEQMVLF